LQIVLANSRGPVNKLPLNPIIPKIAVEHDHPQPLPQKQGLCQVAKVPDFEMLSDF
jgi:hypothetical protein